MTMRSILTMAEATLKSGELSHETERTGHAKTSDKSLTGLLPRHWRPGPCALILATSLLALWLPHSATRAAELPPGAAGPPAPRMMPMGGPGMMPGMNGPMGPGMVQGPMMPGTMGSPSMPIPFGMMPPPELGQNKPLNSKPVFPSDNPWNEDISELPVDPDSDALIAEIGVDKPLHPDFGDPTDGVGGGIPYVIVPGTQPRAPVHFQAVDESDPGDYPIPRDAPIEGGAASTGDRHILVIDRDNWKLYEVYDAHTKNGGRSWQAGSGAIFDLKSDQMRAAGWTSADAAGLPIFPGLVRYDEVMMQKVIPHAIRFTVRKTRRAYVYPARHWASRSNDASLPPMGMRVRLKADYDISGFPPAAKVILTALKKYGMILADNGSDWFISGAPDPRWNDDELGTLKRVEGKDFEVVEMANVVTGQ